MRRIGCEQGAVVPERASLLAGKSAEDGDGVATRSSKEMPPVAECNGSAAPDSEIFDRPAAG